MVKRFKYEIYASNGERIEADVIYSVSQPLKAFAAVDWNKQFQKEIQGDDETLAWPAHMTLEDDVGNYLRITPSPYGLEGSLQMKVISFRFGFVRLVERNQFDFTNVDLAHAGRLISDFVLGNFQELQELIEKD